MVLCFCRAKMGMQCNSATMPVAVSPFMRLFTYVTGSNASHTLYINPGKT